MANTRVQSLFVLTLLQLCRAEISDNLPEWYSANVINDGFQPKPISEIFSTDSPFSSTNPIVVLPKSSSMPDKTLSSTLPPTSLFTEDFTKTSLLLQSSTPLPPTISTISPQLSTDLSSRFPSQPPQVEITQFTEQTKPPTFSDLNNQPELLQTTASTALPPSNFNQQTTLGPLPNYFVVYQQPPQNIQGFPGQIPPLQNGLFGAAFSQKAPSTGQTGTTVLIQPTTTVSPLVTRTTSSDQFPTTQTSTSRGPVTATSTSRRPTARLPTSRGPSRSSTIEVTTRASSTSLVSSVPNNPSAPKFPGIGTLPLRIRVVGPRGSITNVNINPIISHTTTTKRPSTTRTRKTPKPKKNTYEACLCGCKVRRNPICAIPSSATSIDPNKLKGFPSICHMACFNSYKKEPYEKLFDGRCGRLKTRIQTFDSKTKLNREELNKAQYSIDTGDQTIVEVSPLRHK